METSNLIRSDGTPPACRPAMICSSLSTPASPSSLPLTSGFSCVRISWSVPSRVAMASTLRACSSVVPAWAIISATTFSSPIFASLSRLRRTGVACSESPCFSSSPLSTWRLFMWIVKHSNPMADKSALMTSPVSISAATESVPIVSKSHCMNSR